MPKMKTNRTVFKKIKAAGSGRLKRGKAFTSHNTAKKSRKRIRTLRKIVTVDSANRAGLKRQLPYRKGS